MVRYDNFPCTSKVLNYEEDCENAWQRCCYYVVFLFALLFAFGFDFLRLIFLAVGRFIWNQVVINLWKTFLSNFVARLLSLSVLLAFAFLLYWLIKSGKWQELYEQCSALLG